MLGLWWTLAAAMFVNACVYQIFLMRTDWNQQARDASTRVGRKASVTVAPSTHHGNCGEESGKL